MSAILEEQRMYSLNYFYSVPINLSLIKIRYIISKMKQSNHHIRPPYYSLILCPIHKDEFNIEVCPDLSHTATAVDLA
jgi:hypothetical protein